jgi:outer membrane lipoprotein-sorting protein
MTKILRALVSAALLAGLTISAPQVATAQDTLGPFPACKNFDVSFSSTSGNQAIRLERLKDGVFFTITAGSGTIITFNAVDPKTKEILNSVTFDTKGSVTKTTTINGLTTFQVTGFGTLLLFEGTDKDGPSTTVFNGKVTFTLDADGNQVGDVVNSGRTFDICAALSEGI